MDTKRLILAIALSIAVIMAYQMFFAPKPPAQTAVLPEPSSTQGRDLEPVQQKPAAETAGGDISDMFSKEEPVEEKTQLLEPVSADVKGETAQDITVETDLFMAVFTSKGAGLRSFILKKYKDDDMQPLDLVSGKAKHPTLGLYPFYFSVFDGDEEFKKLNKEIFSYRGEPQVKVEAGQPKEIIFEYADKAANISVMKKFVFSTGRYVIDMEQKVIRAGVVIDAPLIFGPDLENKSKPERMGTDLNITSFDGTDMQSINFARIKTDKSPGQITLEKGGGYLDRPFFWAAFQRSYFAVIFRSAKRTAPLKYSLVREILDKKRQELYSYIVVTNPEKVYLGPKDERILSSEEGSFIEANRVIDYGWLGSIAKLMLKGIDLIHRFIPNYGWALVIFTIFLKLILFPLTYFSSVSMAKMQALQPKLKAIRKKYKNLRDPEQRRLMNVETMEIYKREKVNPASGCLPLLLQMPILFAIFNLLRTSINVRHEPWILWIKDLSLKDPIYLLPILMGISQIVLQKMSPTTGDATQRKMMYIFPVVITFFVISLPSGLTLHWFVSNLLQMGQQLIINKKVFHERKEEEREVKALKRKKGVKDK